MQHPVQLTVKHVILWFTVLLAGFNVQAQHNWSIEQGAKANFSIDGLLGISVNGTLAFTNAAIQFDPANPAAGSMNVTLSVASVKTGIGKRDNHLKNADFFDEPKFPVITFHATSVQQDKEGHFKVTGTLKIKDVARQVSIPFSFTENGSRGNFSGQFTINRMDYKVGEQETKGVGKEVRISLNVPVIKK